MPCLQSLSIWGVLSPESKWLAALKQLPKLQTLRLMGCSERCAPPQLCAAMTALTSLRSFSAPSCFNYPALAKVTTLHDLALCAPAGEAFESGEDEDEVAAFIARMERPGHGPDVLAELTRLTALTFGQRYGDGLDTPPPPPLWQAQLASALTALTELQRLELPYVWPGPVLDALAHMTSLTHLELTSAYYQPEVPRLVLPHICLLRADSFELRCLDSLVAPQLQALQGGTRESMSDGVCPFTVYLREGEDAEQQAAMLERCAAGVLRHCNSLSVGRQRGQLSGTTSVTVTAALKVLGKHWRPNPSLVDGTSPFTDVSGVAAAAAAAAAAADEEEDRGTAVAPKAGWNLALSWLPYNRAALACLPQGVNQLRAWCVEYCVGVMLSSQVTLLLPCGSESRATSCLPVLKHCSTITYTARLMISCSAGLIPGDSCMRSSGGCGSTCVSLLLT
jgi:hypothetical protein